MGAGASVQQRRQFSAFGADAEIVVAVDAAAGEMLLDRVTDEIHRVEQLVAGVDHASIEDMLAASSEADTQHGLQDLADVARRLAHETDGRFDIEHDGVDLSLIARAWAVDRAGEMLADCDAWLVRVGSDIAVYAAPHGDPWPVTVGLPQGPTTLWLHSGAAALRTLGDRGPVDPRTGERAKTDIRQIAVVADSAVDACGWSRALAMGTAQAASEEADRRGLTAIVVDAGQTVSFTANLTGSDTTRADQLTVEPNQYDTFAESYADAVDETVVNALYERPAMLELLGDVAGAQVLDLGAGNGWYAQQLVQCGATVTGVDGSGELVRLARERVSDGASFVHADIERPLEFLDGAQFDVVLSALTLHYVDDLAAVFAEARRVLAHDGVFVFSMPHPLYDFELSPSGDYFAAEHVSYMLMLQGRPQRVAYVRRPLGTVFEALTESGFRVDRFVELRPTEDAVREHPQLAEQVGRKPMFFAIRATARELP
jgi:SAM-dependent methyltransferase